MQARGGVEVRLLGTGGAFNECRRQACLLVARADGSGSHLLLDTGNGLDVVRQLVAAGCRPEAVRDVFVSHRHSDHVGGLDPLLLWSGARSWWAGAGPPSETRVYAEPRVLRAIERLFEAIATPVPGLFGERLRWVPLEDGGAVELPGGGVLTPFLVDHEPSDGGALGCLVELGGARLVYSGDTRPCGRLVEIAHGADALFHEACGLDAQAGRVHQTGHSTAGDAARAAQAAGVGRLILTHVPDEEVAAPMLAEARAIFGRPVELATDLGLVQL